MSGRESDCFNFAGDIMERWAKVRPHDLALWCVDESGAGETRFTFAQLAEQFRRAAHYFHSLGLRRGDRVLIILPRVPQWWIAMLGLTKLGAVPIPGTMLLTAKDIRYRIETAEAAAVITCGEVAERVEDFSGIKIAAGEERAGWSSFDAGLRAARNDFEPEPTRADEPAILYFTSGTTGPPKMVLHTQESYGRGHRVTGEWWLCCKPHDVHWNLADNGWAKAAWSSLFGPWHMGACIFAVDARGKFDAAATMRTLAKFPITTWCAPPTALRLIVREYLPAFRFPRLRHCVSAGEPLNPEVIETWKRATGLTIFEGYGQTESVVMIANSRPRGDVVRPGSMGRPVPGFEIALLDEELRELPAGVEGEIAVRVAPRRPVGLFREYWRNPEENAARFRGDWYLTGDRARRDAAGDYWFVGRNDDVIKSAGYRIGPFEVESALVEHPAVVEAAVVGKADELRGAIVKAFVVLRENVEPCEALAHELQEHCKQVTAPYKYPREIEFVAELPKTISGKIRRVELRKR
ncbi:MAG TPA: AMP-binding protein [Chthoniobacteraceae bacterium]|nr:AMP-binding protein [Chthoniobacteraceae bacterium]